MHNDSLGIGHTPTPMGARLVRGAASGLHLHVEVKVNPSSPACTHKIGEAGCGVHMATAVLVPGSRRGRFHNPDTQHAHYAREALKSSSNGQDEAVGPVEGLHGGKVFARWGQLVAVTVILWKWLRRNERKCSSHIFCVEELRVHAVFTKALCHRLSLRLP